MRYAERIAAGTALLAMLAFPVGNFLSPAHAADAQQTPVAPVADDGRYQPRHSQRPMWNDGHSRPPHHWNGERPQRPPRPQWNQNRPQPPHWNGNNLQQSGRPPLHWDGRQNQRPQWQPGNRRDERQYRPETPRRHYPSQPLHRGMGHDYRYND